MPLPRLLALALCALALPAAAEEIGQVGVDWVGNDIIVEAITDPKVQGVKPATSPISTARSMTG